MSSQLYSLHPSTLLRISIWLLHGAALAAVLLFSLAFAYQGLLLTLLLLSLIGQLRSRTTTLQQLRCYQDDWTLLDSSGACRDVTVLANSVVSPYAIFLQLRDKHSQQKLSYLILFDAMPSADFRRLRVQLKLSSLSP
ncbi:MAG: protein YgfX [Sideroxydans sp.]|nr:protein YgfX [Sideroxydans sp.]